MALAEVTQYFKDPSVNWTLRGQAFASQFVGRVDAVRGVYVHLDVNSSDLPIYDKNGLGKVIVFGSTTAVKFGKFVGGVPARMLQNYDHFHRRGPGGISEERIFPTVLSCLFVLDLTHRTQDEIQPIETAWNRSLRTELKNRGLIHPEHRSRAESVNLGRPMTAPELLQIIRPIADRIDS